MGFKKQLKANTKYCEICGAQFHKHEDKSIYRIDKSDRFKKCNTIVVCKDCQSTDLVDIKIRKEHVSDMRRYLSLKGKTYRTKKKYESK